MSPWKALAVTLLVCGLFWAGVAWIVWEATHA